MKVIDIMEPLSSWLTAEMNMLEAIIVMHQSIRRNGLSPNAIVVLDNDKKLLGIVSTTDIMRSILPPSMYLDEGPEQIAWDAWRNNSAAKAREIRVREIMTEDVRVIRTTDTIFRCADRLVVEHVRRLPVIGLDDRVVGMAYLRDVYGKITEILCGAEWDE